MWVISAQLHGAADKAKVLGQTEVEFAIPWRIKWTSLGAVMLLPLGRNRRISHELIIRGQLGFGESRSAKEHPSQRDGNQ